MGQITVACAKCGNKGFSIPNEDAQENDIVVCANCGLSCTVASIRQQVQEAGPDILKQVGDAMKDSLSKTFGKAFRPK